MSRLWAVDWQFVASSHWTLRLALTVVLALLIGGGGYLLRLQNTQETLQQALGEAEGLQAQQQSSSLRAQQLDGERQALALADTRLRDARWRLDADEDLSDLLEQLTLAGHEYGLSFEQMNIGQHAQHTDYHQALMEIRVEGRYPALQRWLDGWLRQIRLLRVTDLEFKRLPARPGWLEARLKVQTFRPGEALAAPASLADEPASGSIRASRTDLFAAWSSSPSTGGLARIPLEQLEMVGSLSRSGLHHALLASAGRVHRVGVGDRLGRGDGEVVHIDERQLVVRERLYAGGTWQERSTVLSLGNSASDEGKDDRESIDKVAVGGPSATELRAAGSGQG